MTSWTKYADERLAVGVDWTALLDGASIAGIETIVATGATLTAERIGTDGAITSLWLAGGTAYQPGQSVHLSLQTSEGETLAISVPVRVLGT